MRQTGKEQTSIRYLTSISATVQSVISGGSKCLLYLSVLFLPDPSSSGCRQGGEGPDQQQQCQANARISPSALLSRQI